MKFREVILDSGKQVFLGKNAENNDKLVREANEKDVLLHTKKPGSPFCNLGEKPTKKEIKQGAVFCALKSQDWRDNKNNVVVHVFKKSDVYKRKGMKIGTWGVRKKIEEIKVKKSEILKLDKKPQDLEK